MHHLKELRESRNLLQKDVASEIRVDRTTYAKYESGTSEPSFEILGRICNYFSVTSDYLIFGKDPDLPEETSAFQFDYLAPDEKQILFDFLKLNDDGRQYIRQTMDMALSVYIKHNSIPSAKKQA